MASFYISTAISGGSAARSSIIVEVDWVAGVGLGGQRLYIVPDKRIVVAVNAGLYDKPLQAAVGNIVLNRYVLRALKD